MEELASIMEMMMKTMTRRQRDKKAYPISEVVNSRRKDGRVRARWGGDEEDLLAVVAVVEAEDDGVNLRLRSVDGGG